MALPGDKAAAYDHFEALRDPSHVRALTLTEFPAMAREVGLVDVRADFFRLPMEVEHQLDISFPDPANRQRLSEMLRADLGVNAIGFEVEKRGEEFWMSYPTLAVVGKKPGIAA